MYLPESYLQFVRHTYRHLKFKKNNNLLTQYMKFIHKIHDNYKMVIEKICKMIGVNNLFSAKNDI